MTLQCKHPVCLSTLNKPQKRHLCPHGYAPLGKKFTLIRNTRRESSVFFISTTGYVHSVVAKIEIEWKLTFHQMDLENIAMGHFDA